MHMFTIVSLSLLISIVLVYSVCIYKYDNLANKYGIDNWTIFNWYFAIRARRISEETEFVRDTYFKSFDTDYITLQNFHDSLLTSLETIDVKNYTTMYGAINGSVVGRLEEDSAADAQCAFEHLRNMVSIAGNNLSLLNYISAVDLHSEIVNRRNRFWKLKGEVLSLQKDLADHITAYRVMSKGQVIKTAVVS